jgi:hypothetical protein
MRLHSRTEKFGARFKIVTSILYNNNNNNNNNNILLTGIVLIPGGSYLLYFIKMRKPGTAVSRRVSLCILDIISSVS